MILVDDHYFTLVELAVTFGRRTALDRVTVQGRRGVNVLLGPNGAGKTTLLRAILGDVTPAAGVVRVSELDPRSSRRRLMTDVGWMPQDLRLPGSVRLGDFVTYAAWLKGMEWGHAAMAARGTLETVGLLDRLSDRIRTLSGGMQRRAAFAAAIVHRPRLLLLDEPMAGLDPEQRAELRSLIRSHSRSSCVVLSTHILQDLPDVADHVVILAEGRICFDGALSDFVGAGRPGVAADLETSYRHHVLRRPDDNP